ncbi:uncharacterized protein LOC143891329 [Tasmannia lanceolata]|uniref:uncharacterized protein LOC143891329 n=1 Tax=Tasmannia lanceolata TaxID=3420 RepID=UPI004062F3B8
MSQAMSVELTHLHSGRVAFLSLVYASCSMVERRELWSYLSDCSQIFHTAWLVGGDFNALLNAREKLGGRPPNPVSCREFQGAIDDAGLIDAGFTGSRFTRCNNQRNGSCVWTRLDRALFNSQWLNDFKLPQLPTYLVHALTIVLS